MTSILFSDSLVYTADHPLTVKEVYAAYAAYGGIHQVHFGSETRNPWLNPDFWETFDEDVWAMDSEVGLVGSDADDTSVIVSNPTQGRDGVMAPHSFVIEFSVDGPGSFIFKRKSSNHYYYISWEDDTISFYQYKSSLTLLGSLPVDVSGDTDLKIMVREFQYSSNDMDRWLQVAVWRDDEYVFADSIKIGIEEMGIGIGFSIESGTTLTWDQEFNPIFAVVIDWGSIDPNEAPMEALSRAVGERHIRQFVRFDGSLMVIRPGTRPIHFTVGYDDFAARAIEFDTRDLATHLRVWSAVSHVEVFDDELIKVYGRRFKEINNPNVYTDREAYEEGLTLMDKMRSNAERLSFDMPFQAFIEPEDIVFTPKGKFIIDSGDVTLLPNKTEFKVHGRKYVYK